MSTRSTGDVGEEIAVKYLKKKGFKILDRNYVQRFSQSPQSGEIDIIAKKDGVISFVEVKTILQRSENPIQWMPEEKVNVAKQRKIRKAAETWLMKNKIGLDVPMQLDIIAVVIRKQDKKATIRYIPNVS